jgi:hypothetical protein
MIASWGVILSKQAGRRYPIGGGPIASVGLGVLYLPSVGRAPAPTPYQRVILVGFRNRTIVVRPR